MYSFVTQLTIGLSLQDLGDLRQLSIYIQEPVLNSIFELTTADMLDKALSAVVQEILVWARQHKADGRYRDMEYLLRHAFSIDYILMKTVDPHPKEDVLPSLASVYEEMGDYPTAEIAQEMLLERLFKKNPKTASDEQIREVKFYSRLLSYFLKRVVDLIPNGPIFDSEYFKLFITWRAAALDIVPLNDVLLEQELIPLNHVALLNCSLHIAVQKNALNLVRLLIRKGADVNSRHGAVSATPLHVATKHGRHHIAKLILEVGAKIEARDLYGRTPLHYVFIGRPMEQYSGMLTMLGVFIDAKVDLEAKDASGRTALCVAIANDLQEVVRYLLEQGANVGASDDWGETVLLTAVNYGREWAIKSLLENGANLVEKNKQGNTALYVAVKQGQEPIIQTLLDHGAMTKTRVDEQNSKEDTVLHCAVGATNLAIVEMLLKAGADVYRRDSYNNTALHRAVIEGQEHMVQLLLRHSAPLDGVNWLGHTVLHIAVNLSLRNMIPTIIAHIDPDKLPIICQMWSNFGKTPLDMARRLAENAKESSDERSVLYLLESALKLSHSFTQSIPPVG